MRIDASLANVKHRALCHRASQLVHAGCSHVSACLHRRNRKLLMKMNENAMRFVHENRYVVTVNKIDDFLQISTDAEVSWINNEHGF
ncbi:hypothetical protein D3C78_910340 [compost metagenome]